MILVTGATSVIGQKLCQLLAENKKPFRAMCRKEEQMENLRKSRIDWTILKPTAFMQNFLSLTKPISKGFLPQIAGNGLVGYIDAQDIARVAYSMLIEDQHKRATYILNGPETLDMQEIALQLSKVIHKKV